MRGARLSLLGIVLLVALGTAGAGGAAAAGRHHHPAPVARTVRLPGELLPALTRKAHLRRAAARRGEGSRSLTLTVVLRRTHQAAFDRYLAAVADPASSRYHRFLSSRRLAERFGPSPQAYAAVLRWLRAGGLRLTQGSANRLTLSVHASQARAARAFGVRIRDYVTASGRRFYANDRDPAVPARLAPLIQDVSGFSDLGGPSRPNAARDRSALRAAVRSLGHASPQGFNSCTNKLFGGNVECTAFVCGLIFTPPAFFGGNLIETL